MYYIETNDGVSYTFEAMNFNMAEILRDYEAGYTVEEDEGTEIRLYFTEDACLDDPSGENADAFIQVEGEADVTVELVDFIEASAGVRIVGTI